MASALRLFMKKHDEEIFVQNLTTEAGLYDEDSTRRTYQGLVRLIMRKIKNEGVIELPQLGKFEVQTRKARMVHDINTSGIIKISAVPEIRFRPDSSIKNYVRCLEPKKEESD